MRIDWPAENPSVACAARRCTGTGRPDPQHTFPGQGVMKPEQAEIARLRKEVATLRMERDLLKMAERP